MGGYVNIKTFTRPAGEVIKEVNLKDKVCSLVRKYNPGIVVITGHDAHYNKKKDNKEYKNSDYYISTVKEIRKIV